MSQHISRRQLGDAVRRPDHARERLGRWASGAIRALTFAVLFFAIGAATSRRACAQSSSGGPGLSAAALDSARTALNSSDWNERHAALTQIGAAYPDGLPASLASDVLALLNREAAADVTYAGDEDFGEYMVDLVLIGVRTKDPRAIPSIMSLGGLGMSSGVAAFVASQGRAVMPALDAYALTSMDHASDVLETYALMYARYGSGLARADSVQVLRRLVGAASDTLIIVRSQLALVAPRGPISELLPAMEDLANSDPELLGGVYAVRLDAGRALPPLARARAFMPTAELLNRLALLTDAACGGGDARLTTPCAALGANLSSAARSLAAGQPVLAVKALDAYQRTAARLGTDRLLPRLTVVTLDGTVRAVIARLV